MGTRVGTIGWACLFCFPAFLCGDETGTSAAAPGTSFRYESMYGVTEEPYPADTGHFNGPGGLFIGANDHVFIAEEQGKRVIEFDGAGAFQLAFGRAGVFGTNATLSAPVDSATAADGSIWVVDEWKCRIAKFDSSGVYKASLGSIWGSGSGNNRFNHPRGIAFDGSGNMYISDSWNHRVQVFSMAGPDPVYMSTVGVTGVAGSDADHLRNPEKVAVDGSGRLYVVDSGNGRVQRCIYGGSSWTCATFLDTLDSPYGVTVKGTAVFIAGAGNQAVAKCNDLGSCDLFAGTLDESGNDNDHLWEPRDVAVDSAGNVFVADYANHRVQVFDSAGAYKETRGVTLVPYVADNVRLNTPWGIAASPAGLLVVESTGCRIVNLDASGTPTWAYGTPGVWNRATDVLSFPEGNPAVGTDGRIYVPDTYSNRLRILDSGGAPVGVFGSGGTGVGQFDLPSNVAVNPVNGDLAVSDRNNQRVLVYSSALVHKATLGVTDVTGQDNTHFSSPRGAAYDAAGMLFVADTGNHRIQKCTVSGGGGFCSTFAGTSGSAGNDFSRLNSPAGVGTGTGGMVFVADTGNNRVQVFDAAGAYITTVGGTSGSRTGDLRGPQGVVSDGQGGFLVTDMWNHRVLGLRPGVPGWRQANIILRSANGTDWTTVVDDGFGDVENSEVIRFAEFKGWLYAGTWRFDNDLGAEVWRSPSGDAASFTRVVANGFNGDTRNNAVVSLAEFAGRLYAGTFNYDYGSRTSTGGEVWRTDDGTAWTQVNSDGFGKTDNYSVSSLAVFDGYLYAALVSLVQVGEVWRCQACGGSDWERVVSNGFGIPSTGGVTALQPDGASLWAIASNATTGLHVWRTGNGTDWTQEGFAGLGDSLNRGVYWGNAQAVFDGSLVLGTSNSGHGAEVWIQLRRSFLPFAVD